MLKQAPNYTSLSLSYFSDSGYRPQPVCWKSHPLLHLPSTFRTSYPLLPCCVGGDYTSRFVSMCSLKPIISRYFIFFLVFNEKIYRQKNEYRYTNPNVVIIYKTYKVLYTM